MEKLWVLVIVTGQHHVEMHALGGPWSSEAMCWNYVGLMNRDPRADYIGRCVTWREYRERWPELKLETQT